MLNTDQEGCLTESYSFFSPTLSDLLIVAVFIIKQLTHEIGHESVVVVRAQ